MLIVSPFSFGGAKRACRLTDDGGERGGRDGNRAGGDEGALVTGWESGWVGVRVDGSELGW